MRIRQKHLYRCCQLLKNRLLGTLTSWGTVTAYLSLLYKCCWNGIYYNNVGCNVLGEVIKQADGFGYKVLRDVIKQKCVFGYKKQNNVGLI